MEGHTMAFVDISPPLILKRSTQSEIFCLLLMNPAQHYSMVCAHTQASDTDPGIYDWLTGSDYSFTEVQGTIQPRLRWLRPRLLAECLCSETTAASCSDSAFLPGMWSRENWTAPSPTSAPRKLPIPYSCSAKYEGCGCWNAK